MNTHLIAHLLTAFTAMAAVSACATTSTNVTPGGPEIRSSAELKKELSSRDKAIRTLRETAGLKVKTADGKSITGSINVTLKRPGALKVEFLGPFMEVEGLFVLKEGMYIFLSMQERIARAGMATPEALGRVMNLPISPDDLESFFCGVVPASDLAGGALEIDPSGRSVGLTVTTKSSIKEYTLSPGSLEIARLEVKDSSGRRSYLIEFPEHFKVNGTPLPRKARAAVDGSLKSVELKFHEAEINPAVDDAEFQVDVPAGFIFE